MPLCINKDNSVVLSERMFSYKVAVVDKKKVTIFTLSSEVAVSDFLKIDLFNILHIDIRLVECDG